MSKSRAATEGMRRHNWVRSANPASVQKLVAPQGFEPRSSESESLVLPLNEGAPGKDHLAGVANAEAFAD